MDLMETISPAAAARPFALRVTYGRFDHRDSYIGTSTYTEANRYETLGCAEVFADRIERYMDVGGVNVIDANGKTVREPLPVLTPAEVADGEIPF